MAVCLCSLISRTSHFTLGLFGGQTESQVASSVCCSFCFNRLRSSRTVWISVRMSSITRSKSNYVPGTNLGKVNFISLARSATVRITFHVSEPRHLSHCSPASSCFSCRLWIMLMATHTSLNKTGPDRHFTAGVREQLVVVYLCPGKRVL